MPEIFYFGLSTKSAGEPFQNISPIKQNGNPFSNCETLEIEINISLGQHIDGLVIFNNGKAESERYIFLFNNNGIEFTIVDKMTKHSTRIWGDSHIDLDDVEGEPDGELSDLKSSDTHTTFMLIDGTRVSFKARDSGLIETVDIIKASQHIHGIGQTSPDWNPKTGLLNLNLFTDGFFLDTIVPYGDIVFAGRDGKDWYNAAGKLIWGGTTTPTILNAPQSPRTVFIMQQTFMGSQSLHQVEKLV